MLFLKAVGLVVEYNPFHNGHRYHIQESKRQTDADIVIAVMSGPFLQRGEPALVSKWARAAMALKSGVDLVIELPYRFATANAELFARGSISLLEALHCDTFSFGSENGNIDSFIKTHYALEEHKDIYNEKIKHFLQQGNSYPRAASLAFEAISVNKYGLDLSKPNNILGKEYIRTMIENHYQIQPFTIKRVSADYHESSLPSQSIASATGIRKAIMDQNHSLQSVARYIPDSTLSILKQYLNDNHSFHDWEMYWPFLKYRILSSSPHQLAQIYEVEEGIENRLINHASISSSFEQFMTLTKTKRYTWTRIQRMCIHILTNTLKEEMDLYPFPSYIRLLGMNKAGQQYLQSVKKTLLLPLISKVSSFKDAAIKADLRGASVFAQGLSQSAQVNLIKREFTAPILEKS